jgi:hypothetical protein
MGRCPGYQSTQRTVWGGSLRLPARSMTNMHFRFTSAIVSEFLRVDRTGFKVQSSAPLGVPLPATFQLAPAVVLKYEFPLMHGPPVTVCGISNFKSHLGFST